MTVFTALAVGLGLPATSCTNGPAMAFGDSTGSMPNLLTVDATGAPKTMLRDTTGHVAWTAPKAAALHKAARKDRWTVPIGRREG